MRGKLHLTRGAKEYMGITPAGAGKTFISSNTRTILKDHPRRCGENFHRFLYADTDSGSPPQVRGKLSCSSHHNNTIGITPAGAGKTLKFFAALHRTWDHPRRCGENIFDSALVFRFVGSPPQVRGKRTVLYFRCQQRRITPAGAGKTKLCRCREADSRDHPRRCGENL